MYKNSSPLDPVVSFEFYILHLIPNCQPLFQMPSKYFKQEGSQWFWSEPLGKNKIAKLMKTFPWKQNCQKNTQVIEFVPLWSQLCFSAALAPNRFARSLNTEMKEAWLTRFFKQQVRKKDIAPDSCKKRLTDIRPQKPLKSHTAQQQILKAATPPVLMQSLQFLSHCRVSFSC